MRLVFDGCRDLIERRLQLCQIPLLDNSTQMKTNLSPTIAVEYTQSIRGRSESAAIVTDVVLIACGTLLLTLLAQVRVPMFPVPITGQSLGVLLLGAALGMRRSVGSVLGYLVLGAIGLPVFAGGLGVATLFGPTGGYLWSFIPAAAVVGYLCERQWDRRFISALLAFTVGHAIIFAGGVAWLVHGCAGRSRELSFGSGERHKHDPSKRSRGAGLRIRDESGLHGQGRTSDLEGAWHGAASGRSYRASGCGFPGDGRGRQAFGCTHT